MTNLNQGLIVLTYNLNKGTQRRRITDLKNPINETCNIHISCIGLRVITDIRSRKKSNKQSMQPLHPIQYHRHMMINYQSRAVSLSPRNFEKYLSRKSGSLYLPTLEKVVGHRLGSSIIFHLYKLENENQAAHFLLQEIIYYLEKRVSFRRLKSVLLQELKASQIEGVRIVCSGRVGGRSKKAQRARKEGFQVGQTLSHVFSSKLSFASGSGLTPFGKVGVKVWICYRQPPLF